MKEKWTVIIIDTIFSIWFSSCYLLGICDIIWSLQLYHELAIIFIPF